MPELSRFYGIIIRMFVEVGEPHQKPHLHAYYQGFQAVFALDPVELLAGNFPAKQRRLVEAWAEIHILELKENWIRLQNGATSIKVDPLQ